MTVSNDLEEMEQCPGFETCSAPLCPRDPQLELKTWFLDEDICRSLQYRQSPLVRRQRQLKRRMSKEFSGKQLTAEFLIETAPVKRTLSPERKAELVERLEPFRFAKKEALPLRKENLALQEGTNG